MTLDLPPRITFNLSATSTSRTRTEIKARHHTVVVDEPPHTGGTDTAATPLETLLAGYLACTNVIMHMIADELEIALDSVTFELAAHLDTDGIATRTPTSVPFPEIELTLNITTPAADGEIERLKAELARRCPVSVQLRASGTKITDTWNVTRRT